MQATLDQWRVPIAEPQNSEEVILSQVGERLYDMFFKNYTKKQWRRDPRDDRIPIRTNRDDRYHSEKFQALPKDGYTALFKKMLDHPKIEVRLNTDYPARGPDDRFASNASFIPGPSTNTSTIGLARSLTAPSASKARPSLQEFFQPAMQVNYPNDHDFTRIVEIKHATGQIMPITTIVREYPADFLPGREPYYPIPAPDAKTLYKRYAELAEREQNVRFVGRLATSIGITIWTRSWEWPWQNLKLFRRCLVDSRRTSLQCSPSPYECRSSHRFCRPYRFRDLPRMG